MIINNDNYVEFAEKAIEKIIQRNPEDQKNPKNLPSTSKIRSILAMTSDIYNDVIHEEGEVLSDSALARIQYLRIRIIYEQGRDDKKPYTVKNFIKTSKLLEIISEVGNSKENYILFARYMEALVAYHRFNGGKDN